MPTSPSREVSIRVSIASQTLFLLKEGEIAKTFSISTALNGAGELQNTGCTPRGKHRIRACIGTGLPINTVFIGRRPTGEIYSDSLAKNHPERDWVLTRILWLCGEEVGRNRLGVVDSMRRYIYIHGTPDTEPMGVPKSHGCIRMTNDDLLILFDEVGAGTPVYITEE
ncbi:MAG: L,D-transpeptidase family protein [Pontibacterium sp.]